MESPDPPPSVPRNPEPTPAPGAEGSAALLQELRVHQIELEMQNEELRRTQDELERAREEYFDLYELAPVGYLTLDEQGLIQKANLAASQLLGVERAHLLGRSLAAFLLPEDVDKFYLLHRQLVASGEPQGIELRLVQKDGSMLWAGLEATLARLSEGAFQCRFVVHDLTRSKRAELEQHRLTERLEQHQKLEALALLVSGVAHNLNNVLAAIMAAGSLLEEDTSPAQHLKAAEIILKSARRGRDVVLALTQFAHPSLANEGPVDLHALLSALRLILENTTLGRVRIIESYASEPVWVSGDTGSLNAALMNLLLNAAEAMPAGGTLTLRTDLPNSGWCELSVKDTGAGMAPEVLARALEPFFTTKAIGQGTGLGLSMARGVVQAHGGTLEITSQPGVGTTALVRLPRILLPTPHQPPPVAAVPKTSLKKVLLVDDDEDVRILMTRMLKRAGIPQASAVASGEAALDCLCREDLPDLVILDQNMPGMNGIQTLEAIRVHHPRLPVLISSGQPYIEEWPCFQQPHVAVISKPFDLPEILAKLAEMSLKQAPPCE